MPSVLIEVRKKYSPEQEIMIMDTVHAALLEAFKIKSNDKNVRFISHEPHRFACPISKEKPELYTHISIDCFAGRSIDAKRTPYRLIVENLEKLSIPKDHIKILLREITPENWGIRGGQAACDVDLEFKINV